MVPRPKRDYSEVIETWARALMADPGLTLDQLARIAKVRRQVAAKLALYLVNQKFLRSEPLGAGVVVTWATANKYTGRKRLYFLVTPNRPFFFRVWPLVKSNPRLLDMVRVIALRQASGTHTQFLHLVLHYHYLKGPLRMQRSAVATTLARLKELGVVVGVRIRGTRFNVHFLHPGLFYSPSSPPRLATNEQRVLSVWGGRLRTIMPRGLRPLEGKWFKTPSGTIVELRDEDLATLNGVKLKPVTGTMHELPHGKGIELEDSQQAWFAAAIKEARRLGEPLPVKELLELPWYVLAAQGHRDLVLEQGKQRQLKRKRRQS